MIRVTILSDRRTEDSRHSLGDGPAFFCEKVFRFVRYAASPQRNCPPMRAGRLSRQGGIEGSPDRRLLPLQNFVDGDFTAFINADHFVDRLESGQRDIHDVVSRCHHYVDRR